MTAPESGRRRDNQGGRELHSIGALDANFRRVIHRHARNGCIVFDRSKRLVVGGPTWLGEWMGVPARPAQFHDLRHGVRLRANERADVVRLNDGSDVSRKSRLVRRSLHNERALVRHRALQPGAIHV